MSAPAIRVILLAPLPAGCASGQGCANGRTGGWLSGWGSGGASAVTLGVHRTWRDCEDRAPAAIKRSPEPVPVPPADPMSDGATTAPSPTSPTR